MLKFNDPYRIELQENWQQTPHYVMKDTGVYNTYLQIHIDT